MTLIPPFSPASGPCSPKRRRLRKSLEPSAASEDLCQIESATHHAGQSVTPIRAIPPSILRDQLAKLPNPPVLYFLHFKGDCFARKIDHSEKHLSRRYANACPLPH